MNSKIIIVCILIISSISLLAQPANKVNFQEKGSTFSYVDIPLKQEPTKGSEYADSVWRYTDIFLKDSTYANEILARYNPYSKKLEIVAGNQVKLLTYLRIDKFSYMNDIGTTDYYENCMNYSQPSNTSAISGFFKVIVDDNTKLLVHHNIKTVRANYNSALDAGNNYDEIVVNENYYVYKNNTLYLVKFKKKSILKIFNDKSIEIENYVKSNKLRYKKPEDVKKIVTYYNLIAD